ncbi:MAG: JAB domain-containing protein [PVC group bacterium]|nr:JAB domain-containing protein [PVC group bacterium]
MRAEQQSLFEQRPNTSHNVNIVSLKIVREKTVKYQKSVSNADDVVSMIRPLFKDSYRELVVVVGLDNSNVPSVIHIVSYGSPNQSSVYAGSVFKPLLLSNSVGFLLVHNHPGDTLTPSSCDKAITSKLKEVGKLLDIPILDHLIVNCDCSDYYSFSKSGIL